MGVRHGERRSAERVHQFIHTARPDSLVLEVCPTRLRIIDELLSAENAEPSEPVGGRYRWSRTPHEFLAAVRAAREVRAAIVPGDRTQEATLSALSSLFTLPQALKATVGMAMTAFPALVSLARDAVLGRLRDSNAERLRLRSQTSRLARWMPLYHEVIVVQRDAILADAIWREAEQRPGGFVVGIVGLGHLDGIEARWRSLLSSKLAT